MGHLFVNDRPLNESGMEKHPLNPMIDPDIRRWLRRQTRGDVGLTPYRVVREGAAAIRAALEAEAKAGRKLVVVDAVVDDDLRAIGQAVAEHKFVTGGSGIAIGLPDNFRNAGLLGHSAGGFSPIAGPGVVLSGSCSTASLAQVAAYVADHSGLQNRRGGAGQRPRNRAGRVSICHGPYRRRADRLFDRRACGGSVDPNASWSRT